MQIRPVTDYEAGISAIDSGYVRPMFDAVHLIVEGAAAAIVDTGTSDSLPRVLDALREKGLVPRQVEWVMLTHVHLDHAGGAGSMMRAFPDAKLAVHPRGARHMADPSKLIEGASAVYGAKAVQRLYGEILATDAARIVEMPHGQIARMGAREFIFLDTPGHARHHASIVDSRTGHIFTGDTFGLSYRELDDEGRQYIFPSTTPVQFDPQALHASVDLIAGYKPGAVYVTHYGQLRDVPRLASDLHRLIDEHVRVAESCRDTGDDRFERLKQGVTGILLDEAARYGWKLPREAMVDVWKADLELNAQGLEVWLDTSAKR
jgi:glyoxylase-like metal-dependent hydrolase (beta-lactamase superfamily II)